MGDLRPMSKVLFFVSLRVSPVVPAYLLNLAAPLTPLPLLHFWLATMVGCAPHAVVTVTAGRIFLLHCSVTSWARLQAPSCTCLFLMPGLCKIYMLGCKRCLMVPGAWQAPLCRGCSRAKTCSATTWALSSFSSRSPSRSLQFRQSSRGAVPRPWLRLRLQGPDPSRIHPWATSPLAISCSSRGAAMVINLHCKSIVTHRSCFCFHGTLESSRGASQSR